MNDLVVSMFDLEKPYGGGNVLFLALSKKGDEAAAPEGKRALIVQSLMPLEREDQTSLDKPLEGIMRHLHHLFPFLENHIEFTDGSWADGQFLRWSYPHFIYETTRDFKWGKGVVPARISKNLYFVGKENFPYLGLEGEIHSGWMVAKEILEQYHG
jgi:phytoene dehydrogenase-like protein